jgi:hypothetical protein
VGVGSLEVHKLGLECVGGQLLGGAVMEVAGNSCID